MTNHGNNYISGKPYNKFDCLIETILLTKIKHSLVDESVELLEILKESQNSPLLVTVLGEFSSGKSTFINALLKEKLLAMKIVPTTATITKLQYGTNKEMEVHKIYGEIEKHKLNDLNKFTVETHIKDDEILSKVFYVKLEIENEFLKEIDLADTPGFNSRIERHTEITKKFIKHSDVIIWLFNSEQMLKKSEIETLEKYCKNFKPIVILNKVDKLDLENPNDIFKELDSQIKKINGVVEKIFPVSSKLALDSITDEFEKSGMQDVVGYFKSNIIPNAKSTKNRMTVIKLLVVVEKLQLIRKEIELKIDKIDNELKSFNKKTNELDKMNWQWENILYNWEGDCSNDNISHYEMLKSLGNYFGIKAPSRYITDTKDEILKSHDSLIVEYERLDYLYSKLQKSENKLDNLFAKYDMKLSIYQNSDFGIKSFVDNLSVFFTGVDLTEEKTRLNKLGDKCNSQSEKYNIDAQKYNHYFNHLNGQWTNLNERKYEFFNNHVLNAMNSQYNILKGLDSEINKEKSKILKLEKQYTMYTNQLDIFNTEIISDAQDLYNYLIQKSENHNGDFVDFEEMIKEFKKFSFKHSGINWKNLYSRNQIHSVIAESIREEVGEISQSEQIAYEERVIQKIY